MEFDVLKDLVRVITRNKVKQIEVLGNPDAEQSRLEEFYDLISKEYFEKEEDAVQYFFQTNDVKDRNYKKLRNRLIRQLMNTSFFIDINQPMFDERTKALHNCYRDFAVAYILLTRDARRAGLYILHQLLQQTEKYEFVELSAEITRYLRMTYSRSAADSKNHQKFTQLHREYEGKRRMLVEALDAYEELLEHYIQKHSPSDEVRDRAFEYMQQFESQRDGVSLFSFKFYSYSIEIIYYFSINDCTSVIQTANEALKDMKGNPNINPGLLFTLAMQKFGAITQLKIADVHVVDETVKECLSYTENGKFNWFVAKLTEIYCYLYIHRYDQALERFEEGFKHVRFGMLPDRVQEEWRLMGSYLFVLALLGTLPLDKVEGVTGTLKISKFENDFIHLARDKEGMNIPVTLLPAIYALASANYESFDDQLEKLDKYRKRYLESDLNQRSARFFQMLFALFKKQYEHSQRSEGRIRKELEKLEALTPMVARQNFAVEPVPYEDLWELLLRKMEEG